MDNSDNGSYSGDLAGTASPFPSQDYLDKGGADPSDHISIIDPDSDISSTTNESDSGRGIIQEIGDDIIDSLRNLPDALDDPLDETTHPDNATDTSNNASGILNKKSSPSNKTTGSSNGNGTH